MINRHEIFRASDARGRDKNTYGIWSENLKERGYLRHLVIGGRIILKEFLEKSDIYGFQILK
jgi:hypothetical protein